MKKLILRWVHQAMPYTWRFTEGQCLKNDLYTAVLRAYLRVLCS